MFADVALGTGFLGMEVDDGLLVGASALLEAAGTWGSSPSAFVAATGALSGTFTTASFATRILGGFSLLVGGGCHILCSIFAMKRCIADTVDRL